MPPMRDRTFPDAAVPGEWRSPLACPHCGSEYTRIDYFKTRTGPKTPVLLGCYECGNFIGTEIASNPSEKRDIRPDSLPT